MGEFSIIAWLDIFWSCHSIIEGSLVQWCWPDGGCLMDQQAYAVLVFRQLRAEAQSWLNAEMKEAMTSGG